MNMGNGHCHFTILPSPATSMLDIWLARHIREITSQSQKDFICQGIARFHAFSRASPQTLKTTTAIFLIQVVP